MAYPRSIATGASLNGSSSHPEGIKPTASPRSRPMHSRMLANSIRGTATPAIWKNTYFERRTAFAPILINSVHRVVSVQWPKSSSCARMGSFRPVRPENTPKQMGATVRGAGTMPDHARRRGRTSSYGKSRISPCHEHVPAERITRGHEFFH